MGTFWSSGTNLSLKIGDLRTKICRGKVFGEI